MYDRPGSAARRTEADPACLSRRPRPRIVVPSVGEAFMIELEGRPGLVTALAYAPDGRALALGGSDGHVSLWDPFAGQLRVACVPLRARGRVSSVAFSADGKLVAAGLCGEVVVWSASAGELLY